jgi:uncharacterized membrane protein
MRARTIVVGTLAASYVAASHWLMTEAADSPWNVLLVVAPMLALLVLFMGQRGRHGLGLALALALATLIGLAWKDAVLSPGALHLGQHLLIYAGLALAFALTLRRGQEPLVTTLARRVHGRLTPAMVAYSRKVTIVWSLCFLAITLLSIALFVGAPFDVWAAFANFGTLAAMALLFVGEYSLRYRLHPEFERASLGAVLRAYSGGEARRPVDPAP